MKTFNSAILRIAGVLLAILISPSSFATLYPKEIKFQHMLENRDIVVGEVRAILQDSQGFMWFGGWNSLVRYDGYHFKHIYLSTIENGKEKLIPSTNQTFLFESSDRSIWVGSTVGLLKFDPRKSTLVKLNDTPGQESLSDKHIMAITEIENVGILVASLGAVFIIDPVSGNYQSFAHNPKNPASDSAPSHPNVNAIHITDNGDILLGTDLGIELFDIEKKTFSHTVPDPNEKDSLANWVKDIAPAADGKLWLSTYKGLVLFDPQTKTAKRYIHDPDDRHSLSKNDVWDILLDSKGRLWVSTDQGGLNLYIPEKDHFIRYQHNSGKPSSIATNVVRTIVEDKSGDLWMGFYPEGIDFFDQSTTAITSYKNDASDPYSLSQNSVLTVSEDKKGNFWVGTDGGGINYFNRETDKFTSFRHEADNPQSLAANAVLISLLDSQNVLWMGHWEGGVTTYDLNTKTFKRLPYHMPTDQPKQSKKLNSHHVWAIYEDSKSDIWIGTHNGGLNKYDRKTGTFTHYWSIENDPTTLNSLWVWCILEDSKNNFWIGTTYGLALMDREKGTFTRFEPDPVNLTSLSEAYVYSLHEDRKGRLWVGTKLGLNLYDYETQTFSRITTEDGLNNDSIRKILEDEKGVLWLATANGVSSYDPETKKIKNFNRDGGELVGGFNFGSGLTSSKGEIVFGGVNGLRIYKPKELIGNLTEPPIVFTQFKIFSDIIEIDGPEGILNQDINFVDSIKLDHKKSMFELHFAALNFRNSQKNQYAYKLEGFDEEWLNIGNQRMAKYTNLDAGSYTFRVRASNNDGVWNEEGRSLTIVQLPPWWETWWAYSLYVLSVFSVVVWAIQHQRKKRQRVEELNRILESKVAERTAELRQKNHDIQAMLSNMRQGLFTIEKGGTVHSEYSQYLEQIFETRDITGKDFIKLLYSRSQLGSNELDQVKEASNAILGEDRMNFEFNSHLLLTEYDANIEGQRKHLSLDWNPIVTDHIVTKLMVSVRDVTQLKKMESEAATQKRELDIISQLLNIQTKKFNNFEKSVINFVQENRQKITENDFPSPSVLALLFRNMHTIKGNCRTYGLSYLSDTAHEVESLYSELKASNATTWDMPRLLDDLIKVEEVLAEYADIFRRVLGREERAVPQGGGPGGVWLDERTIQSIATSLANVQLHVGLQNTSLQLQPIQSSLEQSSTSTLDEVLSDIVDSLSSISQQLHKPAPKVNVQAGDIRIRENAFDLMNNIFSHILRNAVDHGIEAPEQRKAAGKPEIGKIDLIARSYVDHIDIHIRDDGRGLNIPRLQAIGVELGKWNEDSKVPIDDVVQLIFESGVTTAEVVTDISGRGVGMDAVKQYLLESGGEIFVNVLDENPYGKEFVQFETIITLPPAFYVQLKKAS